ncbi:MAG: hypothetical protein HQM07_08160 [Zetaproteobacteria bacterium]|nr:hypothetical protein [Zetaproteobacteria bacterium]
MKKQEDVDMEEGEVVGIIMGVSYEIDDFHIIENRNAVRRRYYVREIADMGSCEYQYSSMTDTQRLQMLDTLGDAAIEELLASCFREFNKPYSAKISVKVLRAILESRLDGEPMEESMARMMVSGC